jgi:hypothetical protein
MCTKATAWRKPRQLAKRVDGLGVRANGAKDPTFTQDGHVWRWTGSLVGVKARACARRGHVHGGDRNGDGDTAARTAIV